MILLGHFQQQWCSAFRWDVRLKLRLEDHKTRLAYTADLTALTSAGSRLLQAGCHAHKRAHAMPAFRSRQAEEAAEGLTRLLMLPGG